MTPKELVEDSWLPVLAHASRTPSSTGRGHGAREASHRGSGPSLCLRAPKGLLAQNCSAADCLKKQAILPQRFMIEPEVTENVRQEFPNCRSRPKIINTFSISGVFGHLRFFLHEKRY
ncbi:unnamed protein product [Leuciscus chuanchicus]